VIANHLESCLPKAEQYVLPGASHGLHIEKPSEFNQVLQEFLDKQHKQTSRTSAGG